MKTKLEVTIKNKIKAVIKESLMKEIVPGAEGDLNKILTKTEDVLNKFVDDLSGIIEEAQDMMKTNLAKSGDVGERNRVLLGLVGLLTKLRNQTSSTVTTAHKGTGYLPPNS